MDDEPPQDDDPDEQRRQQGRMAWWNWVALWEGDQERAALELLALVPTKTRTRSPVKRSLEEQAKPTKKYLIDRLVVDMFLTLRAIDPRASKDEIVARTVDALRDQQDPARVSNRQVWRVMARYEAQTKNISLTVRSAD